MSKSTQHFNHVAVEALSLSVQERDELASRLIRSLENTSLLSEEEHLAIIADRLRQYENGEMTARPADVAIQELRTKYGL